MSGWQVKKMKINIYTFPFRGHVMQAVEIANYLASLGHEICVDTHVQYFKYLSNKIKKKECLYKYLTMPENITKDTLLNCAEGILLTSKNYIEEFELSNEKPDLIIFDSMAYWGKQIADKYKITSVSLITIQPFMHQDFLDNSYQYLVPYSNQFKDSRSFLRSLHIFQEFSKNKYDLSSNFVYDDLLCSTGQHNLVLLPKSFCKYSKNLNTSFKGFSPIIKFNKKNKKKENSIYIATGSMINDLDFLIKSINSLISFNVNIYISAGKMASKLKDIFYEFRNVFIYEFAPQLEILQQCSIFITHGGSNSICEAIYCETPMIVIPFINDEFINAEMVRNCGIGLELKKEDKEFSSSLQASVEKLLSDTSFSINIKKLNKEINSDKIILLVNEIINNISLNLKTES